MERLLNEIKDKDIKISWWEDTPEKIVKIPLPILFEGIFPGMMIKDYLHIFTLPSVKMSPTDIVSIHISRDKGWVTLQKVVRGITRRNITIIYPTGRIDYIDGKSWIPKERQ